ncbi:MAG: hypothetical protein WCA51_09045 [Dehalococcoidia bacterium]
MRKLGMICSVFMMASLLFATSCVTREVPTVETYYETEYRTEYRTETYTETVDAVVESKQGKEYLSPKIKWYTNLISSGFEGSGGTYYYGYQLDASGHSNAKVEIRISPGAQQQKGLVRVYDLTGIGQIPPRPTPFKDWYKGLYPDELNWLSKFNYTLSTARLLGEVRTGVGMDDYIVFDADGIREFGIFATTWHAYSISSVRLTWVDEVIGKTTVTRERQVPYQVPYQVEKQRTVTKTQKVPVWEVILGK